MTFEEKTKYERARKNLIGGMLVKIDENICQNRQGNLRLKGDGFNEFIYQQLLPILTAAYNHFKNSITDLQSFANHLVKTLHVEFDLSKEMMLPIKPYLSHLMCQVSNGILTPHEIPSHLFPMKIAFFRQLSSQQQKQHKRIEIEIAKKMAQTIIKRNWNGFSTNQDN